MTNFEIELNEINDTQETKKNHKLRKRHASEYLEAEREQKKNEEEA